MISMVYEIRKSITNGAMPLIMEIKPKSSFGEDLLQGRCPVDIARIYEDSGACALSVVTGSWYGGSIELLKKIQGKVNLPILRKDFIVSKKSILQSKLAGASSVLLTTKILHSKQLHELVEYSKSIDITPFIEITTSKEYGEIKNYSDIIVGINNMDIESREKKGAGIQRSLNMISKIKKACHHNSLIISASGIHGYINSKVLIDAGFDALLVGTSLLQETNIKLALSEYASFKQDIKQSI